MQIDNHVLTIGAYSEELPHLPRKATVTVWRVPEEYAASGYFVSVRTAGEPDTIPACDPKDAILLGQMELPAHPDAELAAAKQDRLTIINEACDRELNILAETYPPGEVSSWPQQVKEAEAYTADPTASVPLLTAIAESRGITVELLVQKVIEKMEAYSAAAGVIIGKRQALEDSLDAATSIEDVFAVVWD